MDRWRRRLGVLVVFGLLSSGCDYVARVSVGEGGGDADGPSYLSSMSEDGRHVAFQSAATNLVPGDGTGGCDDLSGFCNDDVFVRDLRTGGTRRVSVDTAGGDPDGVSDQPSISGDGRFVAFASTATDLVPAPGRAGSTGVFRRDLAAGTTVPVSVTRSGVPADGNSPSTSRDGRYVAFVSGAPDLVAGDGNFESDVFRRDVLTGTTVRVSVDRVGGDPDEASFDPSISDDGRYIAFQSEASDLVAGDGSFYDIFVRDVLTATTTRVSVDLAGGDPDDGLNTGPSISGDGRSVTFTSAASDLVHGDRNGRSDVFVRDLQAATTVRGSVDSSGGDPDDQSGGHQGYGKPVLSDTGRLVAFWSDATDLVPGDTNGVGDVFVRDLRGGTTTKLEPGASPSISGDGRYVGFQAERLLPDGEHALVDVYVRAVPRPLVDAVTPERVVRGATATLTVVGSGFLPGARASSSRGVSVTSVTVVSGTSLRLTVTVAPDAPTGARGLTVWNPGTGPGPTATNVGSCADCLAVT